MKLENEKKTAFGPKKLNIKEAGGIKNKRQLPEPHNRVTRKVAP